VAILLINSVAANRKTVRRNRGKNMQLVKHTYTPVCVTFSTRPLINSQGTQNLRIFNFVWNLELEQTCDPSIIPQIVTFILSNTGPGSSVGIATEIWAGRSGIESRWGRDFPPIQTGSGVHPASSKMATGSFPGVKYGRCVLLTTHILLVPRSWNSRAISLPTLWATAGL